VYILSVSLYHVFSLDELQMIDKSIFLRGSVSFFLARALSRSVSTSLSVVLTISRSCVLSRQCVLFSLSRSLSLSFSVLLPRSGLRSR